MHIINYLLLLIVGFALIKSYLFVAEKLNIVDKPNSRSSHSQITVRGGGIIIPLFALGWFISSDFQYPLFFMGLFTVSTISFLDDLFQLSSLLRFSIQTVSVLFLLLQFGFFSVPIWLLFIVLILMVGTLNIYNFMDGINGITAGYSIFVLFGFWVINNFQVKFIENEFLYFVFIALGIFAFYNFRIKAVCFAGDIGSISIAFIILFLLFSLVINTQNLIYILFLSIYGVDSSLTIIYRLYLRENIFKPHRKHVYQLMANEKGLSHLFISAIYSIVQLLICLIVFFVVNSETNTSFNLLIGLAIILSLVVFFTTIRIRINRTLK